MAKKKAMKADEEVELAQLMKRMRELTHSEPDALKDSLKVLNSLTVALEEETAKVNPEIDNPEEKILIALANQKYNQLRTINGIATEVGITQGKAEEYLTKLQAEGKVEKTRFINQNGSTLYRPSNSKGWNEKLREAITNRSA